MKELLLKFMRRKIGGPGDFRVQGQSPSRGSGGRSPPEAEAFRIYQKQFSVFGKHLYTSIVSATQSQKHLTYHLSTDMTYHTVKQLTSL